MLYEHVPDMLFQMNGFFDVDKDDIERWYQIRMRHHARIGSLRSDQRQKNSQAKFEHAANNTNLKKLLWMAMLKQKET